MCIVILSLPFLDHSIVLCCCLSAAQASSSVRPSSIQPCQFISTLAVTNLFSLSTKNTFSHRRALYIQYMCVRTVIAASAFTLYNSNTHTQRCVRTM